MRDSLSNKLSPGSRLSFCGDRLVYLLELVDGGTVLGIVKLPNLFKCTFLNDEKKLGLFIFVCI